MKICRSYSYYVPVQCNDASAKPYSYIAKMGTIDADDCAQFCGKVPSPDLVGFNHITDSGGNYCECLYSDQNIPAPPSGLDWYSVVNSFSGSGPISGSSGSPSNTACYTFTVREV